MLPKRPWILRGRIVPNRTPPAASTGTCEDSDPQVGADPTLRSAGTPEAIAPEWPGPGSRITSPCRALGPRSRRGTAGGGRGGRPPQSAPFGARRGGAGLAGPQRTPPRAVPLPHRSGKGRSWPRRPRWVGGCGHPLYPASRLSPTQGPDPRTLGAPSLAALGLRCEQPASAEDQPHPDQK